jgi:L-lactate dehydrogenase complex protein LldG
MAMTNPVIESVRLSLSRARTGTTSRRTEQTPLSLRPAIFESRQSESMDSESEHFLDEVRKLSGVTQRLTPEGVADALKSLVAENNIRKATLWHSPLFEKLGIENILRNLGVEIISPTASKHDMALCDIGFTEADYLLPETGTLVLRSSNLKPRAVSLLPRIHLAIVRPEMLRPDLHQVFAEAKDSPYLVFITGPSRTADIELTVTLGVHGPKNLYVWMMEG